MTDSAVATMACSRTKENTPALEEGILSQYAELQLVREREKEIVTTLNRLAGQYGFIIRPNLIHCTKDLWNADHGIHTKKSIEQVSWGYSCEPEHVEGRQQIGDLVFINGYDEDVDQHFTYVFTAQNEIGME